MIQNIEGFGDTPVVTIGEFLPKSIAGNEKALEKWITTHLVKTLNSSNNEEVKLNSKHLAWSDYAQKAKAREKLARGRAVGILKDIVSVSVLDDEHLVENSHGEKIKSGKIK